MNDATGRAGLHQLAVALGVTQTDRTAREALDDLTRFLEEVDGVWGTNLQAFVTEGDPVGLAAAVRLLLVTA